MPFNGRFHDSDASTTRTVLSLRKGFLEQVKALGDAPPFIGKTAAGDGPPHIL